MRYCHCVGSLAFAAVASILAHAFQANSGAGSSEPAIENVLAQYVGLDPSKRDAAALRLFTLGKPALPHLEKLEKSPDLILARHARDLRVEIKERTDRPLYLQTAAFFRDGNLVAFTSVAMPPRCFVGVRQIDKGEDLVWLRGTPFTVAQIDFSPDGRFLAIPAWRGSPLNLGTDDYWIGIWDWANGTRLKKLVGHTDGVGSARYSPDGNRVLSSSLDGTIRLWNAHTGQQLVTLQAHPSWCMAIFSGDGKRLISSGDDRLLRIWDAMSHVELARIKVEARPAPLAASPDGRFVVAVLSNGWTTKDKKPHNLDGEIVVLDLNTNAISNRISCTDARLGSVAIQSGGKRVLTGDALGQLRLWDMDLGKEVAKFQGQRREIPGVCFSKDGKRGQGIDSSGLMLELDLPARAP